MKKLDIVLIILFPILAFAITVIFKANQFVSNFLFFGIPAAYIALRNRGIFWKSFLFAAIFFFALCPFFDALGALDKSWIIPYTILPFRFFGVSTIENYIFGFLWVLFSILFYEHFFDKGNSKDKLNKNIRYLIGIAIFLVTVVVSFWLYNLKLLTTPYFYLWASLIFIMPPLIIFLYFYPKFLKNFVLLGAYFFFFLFLFEIAALQAGQWVFPGMHFIGFVDFLKYRFPLEELIFWMMFATPSLIAYYEFFADDRK